MAIRPIITAPDPVLKTVSEPVSQVDDAVRRLLEDMLDSMYAEPGIGLSAIQLGVPKRLIVTDVAEEGEPRAPRFLVNPEILEFSEESAVYSEGCLSLPGHFADLERPERIKVRFLDEQGRPQTLETGGLLSRCIQHEMDHLDGVLFVDRLSQLKRNMILRKLAKAKRQKAPA